MVMTPFEYWWHHEGSQPPAPGLDMEEHCKRMCKIAWDNGAYKEREACAKVCDEMVLYTGYDCAGAIRARIQP